MAHTIHLYMSQWSLFGGNPGLSLFSFDTLTGRLRFVRQLSDSLSLGCSVVDPEKKLLYVCNETNLLAQTGCNTGRIYGYRIDPDTGDLRELFHRDTWCPFPDYISFDPEKKYMIVPHHSWATCVTNVEQDEAGRYRPVTRFMDSLIDVFSVNADGTLGELTDVCRHGFGEIMRDFENKITVPHPHCAVRSPSGRLFAVCDKGDGHIYIYTLDTASGKLEPRSRLMTDVPLSEPRYCAFHPTLPYLFVNHEHTGHGRMPVTALRYSEDGSLQIIDTVDSLAPDYEGPAVGQGFCISPDGRYLYNLLQGACQVAVLKVDQVTGKLTRIQNIPVNGVKPRSCALSPDGRFLITACISGEISVYAVNADGTLSPTPHGAFLSGSAYITFYDPQA